LVAAAQADPRALAPLYARYFDPVYRYCRRRLGDRDAAADAAGQVFAKALAALPRYRDRGERGGSFRAWLFAIAHNTITDGFRARPPDAPLAAAAFLADGARERSPEEAALAAETRRSLHDVLAGLPVDQRRVVELRLAGLTGPEIAAALGKNLGAVKIAQHRAFARLRVLLADEAPGEGVRHAGA
jgi:RNA polymerase sigma-70 factor (ECF subfamily)